MKDYPDKMTVEQARVFGEDVLNIVSQIPCGKVTTYGHIAALAGWPMGMWIFSGTFGSRRCSLFVLLIIIETKLNVLDDSFRGIGGSCDHIDLLGLGILDLQAVPLL